MTYDWLEKEGYADEIIEPVNVRYLCEQNTIILRPNEAYYFKVDETCGRCTTLAAHYDSRYKNEDLG